MLQLAKFALKALQRGQFLSFAKGAAKILLKTRSPLISSLSDLDRYSVGGKVKGIGPVSGAPGFSFLMPTYLPKLRHFEEALVSVLDQGDFQYEILIGLDGPHPAAYKALIKELQKRYPKKIIKSFEFPKGGISATTNGLAQEARNDFLILMDHDDWLMPSFLSSYSRQTAAGQVLYCHEYKIDERGYKIYGSDFYKFEEAPFPYFFVNSICHALCVPKDLWEKVSGLRRECDGAQDYDLCLRLNLAGAKFQVVPEMLYAWRAHAGSTALNVGQKDYATAAGERALRDYIRTKHLNWDLITGDYPTNYRARPQVPFLEYERRDFTNEEELPQLAKAVLSGEVSVASKPIIFFANKSIGYPEDCIQELLRWVSTPEVGLVTPAVRDISQGRLLSGGKNTIKKSVRAQPEEVNVDESLSEAQRVLSRVVRLCKSAELKYGFMVKRDFLSESSPRTTHILFVAHAKANLLANGFQRLS